MPELPEVENTRRYLEEAGLVGSVFTGVSVGWANAFRLPGLEDFVLSLPGSRVEAVQRRAKYLLLPLNTGNTLILHLGMAGGLLIQPKSSPPHSMVRNAFALTNDQEMRFIDPRKFGKIWLAENVATVLPPLGPDPLSEGFTVEALAKSLGKRNIPIKPLLLEQSIAAGVGNLYADESLYLAGIHPLRLASDLSKEEIPHLRDSIVKVLTSAVASYDRRRAEAPLESPLKLVTWTIPRSAGAPCARCGNPISMTTVRGRTTFFCTKCQH